jgi:hypothetical protein
LAIDLRYILEEGHFFVWIIEIFIMKSCKYMYMCIMPEGLSWSYGSWIYSYLCNQCLSPLMLRVRIQLVLSVLDTTLCDKACQWPAAGQWFSDSTPVSSTNKADRHDVAEILLKVALNTITLILWYLNSIPDTYSRLACLPSVRVSTILEVKWEVIVCFVDICRIVDISV